MRRLTARLSGLAIAGLVLALSAACATGAPPSALPTEPPAGDYASFRAAGCAAFQAMDRAIGNPDADIPSALRRQLDDQIANGNLAGAEETAARIKAEIDVGRRHAADAARWAPAAPMMAAFDRFLAASATWMDAKVERLRDPAAQDPQQVLEASGGVEAWFDMLRAGQGLMGAVPSGVTPEPCDGVPVHL